MNGITGYENIPLEADIDLVMVPDMTVYEAVVWTLGKVMGVLLGFMSRVITDVVMPCHMLGSGTPSGMTISPGNYSAKLNWLNPGNIYDEVCLILPSCPSSVSCHVTLS